MAARRSASPMPTAVNRGTSQLISFLKLDAYIRFLQTKLRFATA
jgi:hypothetical protein